MLLKHCTQGELFNTMGKSAEEEKVKQSMESSTTTSKVAFSIGKDQNHVIHDLLKINKAQFLDLGSPTNLNIEV